MSKPTVSACMPHRDYTEYIGLTLKSLVNQTHQLQEISIMDDESSDEHWQALKELAMDVSGNGAKPKLTLGRCTQPADKERSKRIPYARNRAFENLTGPTTDYIFFPDADDLWNVEYVERCISIMEENPEIDFVYPDITYFQNGQMSKTIQVAKFDLDRLFRQCYITCCTMMRTEAFLHAGMWPEDHYKKEYVFWNTIARLGHVGRRLPGRYFYYHQHAGQRHTQYVGKPGVSSPDKHERYNSRMYISKKFNVPLV